MCLMGLGMPSLSRSRTSNRVHRSRHRISRYTCRLISLKNNIVWEPYRIRNFRVCNSFWNCTVRKPLSSRTIPNCCCRNVPIVQRKSKWIMSFATCISGSLCTVAEARTLIYLLGAGITGLSTYLWVRTRRVHRRNKQREEWYRESFARQERASANRKAEITGSQGKGRDRIGGKRTDVFLSPRNRDRDRTEGRATIARLQRQDRPLPVVRENQSDAGGDQD